MEPYSLIQKVENNSLLYDHNEGTFKKGDRLLTLAWTDGFSVVPTLFRMMSSAETACKSEKKDDGRGICSKRRTDSFKTMTDSAMTAKFKKKISSLAQSTSVQKNDEAEKLVKLVFCKLKEHQDSDFVVSFPHPFD